MIGRMLLVLGIYPSNPAPIPAICTHTSEGDTITVVAFGPMPIPDHNVIYVASKTEALLYLNNYPSAHVAYPRDSNAQ